MGKVKIEIKNRWTGSVLFEYEKENNTLKNTLIQAVKAGANLEGADLAGANLEGAYLEGAYLAGADLAGANLEGAYLEGAYLAGTYLAGADLAGANLAGAYLEGTYLAGADLAGANLAGAYIYVSDNKIDTTKAIKKIEEKGNIKIKEYYINKNIIPTKWNCFWKYGLIICDYEIAKTIKKLTIEEAEKELSEKYDCQVKIED